jgi:uncharacterized protein YjbI with pentapeptide repeats
MSNWKLAAGRLTWWTLAAIVFVVSVSPAPTQAIPMTCRAIGVLRLENGTLQICAQVGNKRFWQSATSHSTSGKSRIRASEVFPGSDLTRQNLRGINLEGRDISTARMPFADLTDAKLAGAFVMSLNFASANLTNSDLSRTYGGWLFFNGANLAGANLSNSYLPYSNFDAYVVENTMIRVNLRGANLDSATLRGSTFENADFDRASAKGANFQDSLFIGTSLRDANLTGANFVGATLSNANFTGSKLGDDWRTLFRGARFENTTWVDGKVYSAFPGAP